ncbi:MAG: hypothetical protein K2W95_03805 [Candidatus Obscuribacterales bacterium]|nr:hypothetical protein [Candidatus Obscuribacterales bacterium]
MEVQTRPLELMEIFTGTLLAPVATFRRLVSEVEGKGGHLPTAAGVVVCVFALDGLRLTSPTHLESAAFHMALSAGYGASLWASTAGALALAGACFKAPSTSAKAAFVTLGWSMLPWLFTAPLFAMKEALGALYALLMCIPLIWIFCLQLIAITQSYRMQAWQSAALVLLVPGLISTVQFLQFIQSVTAAFPGLFS